jgi:hypothetical protein
MGRNRLMQVCAVFDLGLVDLGSSLFLGSLLILFFFVVVGLVLGSLASLLILLRC